MDRELSIEFIEELISLSIRNKDFFTIIKTYLKTNYLPTEEYREIWEEVLIFYDENNKLPSWGSLSLSFKSNLKIRKIINKLKRIVVADKDALLISFEDYIKRSKFVEDYDKLAELYNDGDFDKAYEYYVNKAESFSKFSLVSEKFERIFGDYRKRNLERLTSQNEGLIEYIPTGIMQLDKEMDGGLRAGEAMMGMGISGIGKSFFLISCGLSAARRGHNVVHFQLEGTKKQINDRYDAAWTGSLYREIRGGLINENKNKAIDKILDKIRGEIFVDVDDTFESMTIAQIRSKSISLIKKYGHIPLIIIDYFELVSPGDKSYSASEERFRQNKLGEQFKALAVELDTRVITVTQASNVPPDLLQNPDFVLTRDNLSENKLKIKPFDVFITFNQTKDEKAEKIIRIAGDKFRDSEGLLVFPICQNLARSRFYDKKRSVEMAVEISEKIKAKKSIKKMMEHEDH